MTRINTSAILNNSYLSGSPTDNKFSTNKISVAPSVSGRYDYSVTEDQSLLIDRKDTDEKLYEIFKNSPYAERYMSSGQPIKIDKKDIFDIFYYCKEHLEKIKDLTAYEMTIAINEFFDFNYIHELFLYYALPYVSLIFSIIIIVLMLYLLKKRKG